MAKNLPASITPHQLKRYYPEKSRNWFPKDLKQYYHLVDELMGNNGITDESYYQYTGSVSEHYQNIYKGGVLRYYIKLLALYHHRPAWFGNQSNLILIANIIPIRNRLAVRIEAGRHWGRNNVKSDEFDRLIPAKHLFRMADKFENALYLISKDVAEKLDYYLLEDRHCGVGVPCNIPVSTGDVSK
jgi:hypothetical protein